MSCLSVSVFSMEEMNTLLWRANDYIMQVTWISEFNDITFITRDKSRAYYDHILFERDGVMEVYPKDSYGSPECPLNLRIPGLYFMAKVDPRTGLPYPDSPFGDCRLKLHPSDLITPESSLYFGDFYCMMRGRFSSRGHYNLRRH